jgi:hypothetical protein
MWMHHIVMTTVIRDYLGNLIATQNKDLPFIADAMTVEAYALREGLCIAQ